MLTNRNGVKLEYVNICSKCICDGCANEHNGHCPKYKTRIDGRVVNTPCACCEGRVYVVQCDSLRRE